MDDCKAKRQHLVADISELNKCADSFLSEAEKKRDFSLVAKSNTLRKSAHEKQVQLADIEHEISNRNTMLKEMLK